jgi:hypothetical protein
MPAPLGRALGLQLHARDRHSVPGPGLPVLRSPLHYPTSCRARCCRSDSSRSWPCRPSCGRNIDRPWLHPRHAPRVHKRDRRSDAMAGFDPHRRSRSRVRRVRCAEGCTRPAPPRTAWRPQARPLLAAGRGEC